jgi:hypothetical protein
MRNVVSLSVLVLAMAGTACNKESQSSQQPKAPQDGRTAPAIGGLAIRTATVTPPALTFNLNIEPGKFGVSPEKSECYACPGEMMTQLTPKFIDFRKLGGGPSWGSGPGWWFAKCKLTRTTNTTVWAGQLEIPDGFTLVQPTVPISFLLLDDQESPSNQLDVWIDFAQGRLVDAPKAKK